MEHTPDHPDFWSIAEALGHTSALKSSGGEVRTRIKPESLPHLRSLLSRASDEEREARGAYFFDRDHVKARQDRPEGHHDRAHAYLFADGELPQHPAIDAYLEHLDLEAVSVQNKTLAPDEVWDLGTSTNPVVLNLGTLTMGPGARIEIRNSILSLTCQTLIRESGGGSGSANYDIGILGVQPAEPEVASQGGTGGVGTTGKEGTCKCSDTEPEHNGGVGGLGGTGGEGSPGVQGLDGLPGLRADITIRDLQGSLAIMSRGGDGGKGGQGARAEPAGQEVREATERGARARAPVEATAAPGEQEGSAGQEDREETGAAAPT